MAHLLAQAPEVEAVFVVSDLGAVGALMECLRRGIAVPGRISVMGFGDFDIAAQCVPALTTIAVGALEIGRRAGTLLTGLLAGETAPDQRIDVGFTLISRASTASRR